MINQNDLALVTLQSMNETHFEEVAIINSLLAQIDIQADYDTLCITLDKLLAHMLQHFSGEEELMRNHHYPSLNMHKADHDKVLNQARYAEMQWRNKKDVEALKEYIEDDVVVWLDQHIKAMDTPMADYILQITEV